MYSRHYPRPSPTRYDCSPRELSAIRYMMRLKEEAYTVRAVDHDQIGTKRTRGESPVILWSDYIFLVISHAAFLDVLWCRPSGQSGSVRIILLVEIIVNIIQKCSGTNQAQDSVSASILTNDGIYRVRWRLFVYYVDYLNDPPILQLSYILATRLLVKTRAGIFVRVEGMNESGTCCLVHRETILSDRLFR